MKFGKELKLKSVAEWRDKYMSYKKLKRVIGKLAVQIKQQQERDDQHSLDTQVQHMEQQHSDTDADLASPLSPSNTAATQPATAIRLPNEVTPLLHRRDSSTSSLVKRRLGQAYGTSEDGDGEAGSGGSAGGEVSMEQEQREMLAGDAKKEFNAIVDNDIDKVNKHFREKLHEYKQRYQQLYEQIRALGIEEREARRRDGNGSSAGGGNTVSTVIEVSNDSPASAPAGTSTTAPNTSTASSSTLRPLNLVIRPTSPLSLSPLTPPPLIQRPTISTPHAKKLESLSERLLALYRECCQLDSFATLNYDGLRKIMKKYDKQTGEDGHQEQMKQRLESEPFMKQLDDVRELQRREENLHHRVEMRRGTDIRDAMTKLKLVKKDVDEPPENDEDDTGHVRYYYVLAAFVTYFLLLFIPLLPAEQERAQRCAALLALITILWVTEAIPFFVSSLMIPFFVILNGILADETGEVLSATKASKAAFGCMFNDTIMLILGGFSISAAFSKCGFELRLAAIIQRQLGSRPHTVSVRVHGTGSVPVDVDIERRCPCAADLSAAAHRQRLWQRAGGRACVR